MDIDLVRRQALGDEADGDLDLFAGLGGWEGEAAARLTLVGVGDGAAAGVVEVAELLATEGG
jgi:hypothetical protein